MFRALQRQGLVADAAVFANREPGGGLDPVVEPGLETVDPGGVRRPAAVGESPKQGRRTLSGSGHAHDCLPNGGIDLAGISRHQLDRRGDRWTGASAVVAAEQAASTLAGTARLVR